MTVQEAAHIILKEEGGPLGSKEIAERILKNNLVKSWAKNPIASISQTIEKNIRERKHLKPNLIFQYDRYNNRKIWLPEQDKKMTKNEKKNYKISMNIPDDLMEKINVIMINKGRENQDEILVSMLKRGFQDIITERINDLENQLIKLKELS